MPLIVLALKQLRAINNYDRSATKNAFIFGVFYTLLMPCSTNL